MCNLDKQLDGTLPAYVFSLLAIYYLQQCSPPVLPVLHEVFSSSAFFHLLVRLCWNCVYHCWYYYYYYRCQLRTYDIAMTLSWCVGMWVGVYYVSTIKQKPMIGMTWNLAVFDTVLKPIDFGFKMRRMMMMMMIRDTGSAFLNFGNSCHLAYKNKNNYYCLWKLCW